MAPRSSHAAFQPAAGRPDPVELLESQAQLRVPELVPIRYGRMLASPFTFYRGAALIMASDLADTPTSGLRVQCCGDAHLSNFGLFASPERRLVFDINDFDETLPGPWEWDVKRLAVSLLLAARDNGFGVRDQERIVLRGGRPSTARGWRATPRCATSTSGTPAPRSTCWRATSHRGWARRCAGGCSGGSTRRCAATAPRRSRSLRPRSTAAPRSCRSRPWSSPRASS